MGNLHRIRLTTAVVVTAAVMAGCGPDRNTSDAANETQLEPVMSTMDDGRIEAAVRSDYFTANQVKADNIDVSSDRGVVTLKGRVASDAVRQRAVSIAKAVEGVTRVNDQLQVQNAGTVAASASTANRGSDEDTTSGFVTTKILAQYYLNPQLKPWNIDVSTSEDGVVTLEGKIDSDQDRSEAVRIAKSTDGVTDVRDRLRAGDVAATAGTTADTTASAAGGDLSDAWTTTKIQSRYFIDPDIKGRDINVETRNGVVVLRGTVGSYSARRQAVGIARRTDGVREVQDELRVDTGGDNRTAATRGSAAVDDDWITTKVQSKFLTDGALQGSGVEVKTSNGVVTLSGTVASKEAKDSAVQLARDTEGVKNVRDRLTVRAPSST